MDEVRRPDDDELCGFVAQRTDGWHALTVFGTSIGAHADRSEAAHDVLEHGLAVLMERWTLRDAETGAEEIVCLQEANPHGVTVPLGYYSMPGVPTLRITRADLDVGRWTLTR